MTPEEVTVDIPLGSQMFFNVATSTGLYEMIWRTRDGKRLLVRKLSQSHLLNLIKSLNRSLCVRTFDIVRCELTRRMQGHYPENFEMLCRYYYLSPEVLELEIIFKIHNPN